MPSCFCGQSMAYQDCCLPLHLGLAHAQSAEQLMRSRYSAYVCAKIDYIVQTTLPTQQARLDRLAMLNWSKNSDWHSLTVHEHQIAAHSAAHAWVRFTAEYRAEGQNHRHEERSAFVRLADHWYFIDPNIGMQAGRNAGCPCGSGAKFKTCCADMLQ